MTKYDEVMDKIEVTPEMRARILKNVAQQTKKPSRRLQLRRFGTLAACLAVLLAGALTLPGLLSTPAQKEPETMVANGMAELPSRSDLSDAVGFPVKSAETLPFFPREIHYTSYWGDMAQIDYVNEDASACFRQSLGTDDNSGDWNEYPAQCDLSVGALSVTLKGDGSQYTLAVWTDGTYSYSLSLSAGQPAEVWQRIIEGVG